MSDPNRKEYSYSEKPNSSDLIYRQDVLEALRTCYETERIDYTNGNEYINYDQAVHEVEELPSAQPEIIRCRDCEHYQFADNRAFGMPVKMCKWFGFEDVDDNDFCSRAERRTDE